LSRPFYARFDLYSVVAPSRAKDLAQARLETSAEVQARVRAARDLQRQRQLLNARMPPDHPAAALDEASRQIRVAAVERLGISVEHLPKAARVARTIADLAGADAIRSHHYAEAIQHLWPNPARPA
jgi:magnesium chelatase family protein